MRKYFFAALLLFFCFFGFHCAVAPESRLDDNYNIGYVSSSSQGVGGNNNFTLDIDDDDFSDNGNFGGAGTCYADEVEQESLKINIVFLLDRSASMSGYIWSTAILQLEKFIKDKKASDINVALSYFPSLPDDLVCDEKEYESPVIPFGTLPGNANNLINSLITVQPSGSGTPLFGGMIGTYNWLIPFASTVPGEQTILLILSDGTPNTCSHSYNSKQELHDTAANALSEGVKTGTIALAGANLTILNEIAKGGGTKGTIDITYDPTELHEALNQIRNSFQCEYKFDTIGTFDPDKWFVKYISSNGFPDWIIPRVLNKSECSSKHGWYYDDNVNPKKITLCDQACEILSFDNDFLLKIAFGCPDDPDVIK